MHRTIARERSAGWQPGLWIPGCIEQTGFQRGLEPRRFGQLRIEDGRADFQMRIQCLACDEEPHDFTGALEDSIDAAIAHEALDRDRFITTSFERIGSLVTATATN